IGYSFFSGQSVFKEYDTEKDYLLYNYVSGSIILDEGMFAVFFPDDIHQPGLMIDEPMKVKKAVVKVRL
ncbi:MAG: YhcH/YjgK/YiaL family protein, partial [Ignavibacteria bacterium]|nr:YhcH/YjgK/YiaL family protein [Ignavibacteria bacterium]